MTDLEIVAYVHVHAGPPPDMPRRHRLYYRDPRKGWWYPTNAGYALLRANRKAAEPLIQQHQAAVDRWAEAAAHHCLTVLADM